MNVLCDFETKINRGWHLVITGGEPLLQEEALEEFLQFLEDLGILPYIEIETNCTIIPQNKKFIKRVTNWNVSPKLNNSGMPIEVREFARVYKWFNWQRGTIFKYVISTDKDYRAVERLIQSGWIIRNKVWLMPAASSRQELIENNKRVAELAKKNDVKFCTRLQLEIYNRATGV
jgi:organic radical activating enzyme